MIIPRADTRILVQGITGKQGTFWTERMQAYGARIVGGVNPKKAGAEHCGVLVYGSAVEAARDGFDVSILFIPPLAVKAAALDAIEGGRTLRMDVGRLTCQTVDGAPMTQHFGNIASFGMSGQVVKRVPDFGALPGPLLVPPTKN